MRSCKPLTQAGAPGRSDASSPGVAGGVKLSPCDAELRTEGVSGQVASALRPGRPPPGRWRTSPCAPDASLSGPRTVPRVPGRMPAAPARGRDVGRVVKRRAAGLRRSSSALAGPAHARRGPRCASYGRRAHARTRRRVSKQGSAPGLGHVLPLRVGSGLRGRGAKAGAPTATSSLRLGFQKLLQESVSFPKREGK